MIPGLYRIALSIIVMCYNINYPLRVDSPCILRGPYVPKKIEGIILDGSDVLITAATYV